MYEHATHNNHTQQEMTRHEVKEWTEFVCISLDEAMHSPSKSTSRPSTVVQACRIHSILQFFIVAQHTTLSCFSIP